MTRDDSEDLIERVRQAIESRTPLCIRGGGSKSFYGREPAGETLSTASHSGVVDYEPTELVLTARSGTPLEEIEALLAEHGQMLAFEPPHFDDCATLGGAIACGLSGPRRPYVGAARDFVLGVRMINGRGEDLRFGGQVMKNVAGYDVSRLMTGSMGTLGVLLEVSLKVLPRPRAECTLVLEAEAAGAAAMQARWSKTASPISATCHVDDLLHVRLSGSEKGIASARDRIGGEESPEGDQFWLHIREQRHPFFRPDRDLWRVSVPPAAPALEAEGEMLTEWSGALRWIRSNATPQALRDAAARRGGHATLFRGADRDQVFHPLSEGLLRLHKNVKKAFDPSGIFNRGRMYEAV